MFGRKRRRSLASPGAAVSERLNLDFAATFARRFPVEFPNAWKATAELLEATRGKDFSMLARNSPGLQGFDWGGYLRLSTIRVVHAQAALSRLNVTRGRLLDYGAYFGNFALTFARAGFTVTAVDSYAAYGDALAAAARVLREGGVEVLDSDDVGRGLTKVPSNSFDVVVLMGVLEHIPHTPRALLESVRRVLRPGGILLLDTPNLAYVYNRQRLARGQPIGPPIEKQFVTEVPFEGHHREYTLEEVRWMLDAVGMRVLFDEMFSYSLYGLGELSGIDLQNFRIMEADPSQRELVLVAGQKPLEAPSPEERDAR